MIRHTSWSKIVPPHMSAPVSFASGRNVSSENGCVGAVRSPGAAPCARLIAPVDPLTCASNLKDRKVLLLAARRDDIVPPRMAEALWQATGKQEIVWFDCTHYGAVKYSVPAMEYLVRHFGAG